MSMALLGFAAVRPPTYQAFLTRMVYLYYVSCLRYTILVGNPQYDLNSYINTVLVNDLLWFEWLSLSSTFFKQNNNRIVRSLTSSQQMWAEMGDTKYKYPFTSCCILTFFAVFINLPSKLTILHFLIFLFCFVLFCYTKRLEAGKDLHFSNISRENVWQAKIYFKCPARSESYSTKLVQHWIKCLRLNLELSKSSQLGLAHRKHRNTRARRWDRLVQKGQGQTEERGRLPG